MSQTAHASAGTATAGRPSATRLVISPNEAACVEQIVELLERADGLYQRGGMLVRVMRDSGRRVRGLIRQPRAPRIEQLPQAQLRRLLTPIVDFHKVRIHANGEPFLDDEGRPQTLRIHPPPWAVEQLGTLGDWPTVRNLEAVVESPILRPDGTVLQSPGYDDRTGVLFVPPEGVRYPEIKDSPTAAEVRRALDSLLDVVVDFPFKSPAHRSAWLAGLLTYFARFSFAGSAPLFLVDANVRGGGKGLLCEVVGHICMGREMDVSPYSQDDREQKNVILSIAMAGDLLVLIDNVDGPLGSGPLDAALTTTGNYSDRLLNTNQRPSVPLMAMFWVTGNNVQFRKGCDTARRAMHIRLESPEEHPEERSNYRHPDLVQYVKQRRHILAAAAVTLLRAYHVAGRPRHQLTNWGRFEAWSHIIRECVVWLGLPDPYETHKELVKAADTTSRLLEDLIEGWRSFCEYHKTSHVTVREVVEELQSDVEYKRQNSSHELRFPQLYNALLELCPTRDGRLETPHRVANALRRYRGRVVHGLCLDTLNEKTEQGQLWTIRDPKTSS